MSYEGSLYPANHLPLAAGAVRGAVIVGSNIGLSAGTISINGANVNAALGTNGLADSTLSTNVALYNATTPNFAGNMTVGGASGLTLTSGQLRSTVPINFLNGSAAVGVNVGQLLVSSAYADVSKVPTNGAYIKGSVVIGNAGLLTFRNAADNGNITVGAIDASNNTTLTATVHAIAATTANAVPTSYLGLNANNGLFVDSSNGTVVNSTADVIVLIDSDNSDTTRKFAVRTNANTAAGGTLLFSVSENGRTMLSAATAGAASLNLPHGVAPTTPLDGDFWTTTGGVFTRVNGADRTVLLDNAVDGTSIAYSGGVLSTIGNLPGAMSVPVVVTADVGTGNATYTLPYLGNYEMVWKSGAIQVRGTDYTRTGNQITFVAGNIPLSTSKVTISVSVAATDLGAMSVPAIVAADAGTGNATYTLPTTGGYEMVWKSGAIQVRGTDYTRTGTKITFVAGNIPLSTAKVVISCSISDNDIDAITLQGSAPAVTSTANAIVKTTAGGVIDSTMLPDMGTYMETGTLEEDQTLNADGTLATVTWKNGATTVKTLTITYNSDGSIATKVYVANGKTATHTYAYGSGTVTVTKAVV